jgi:hypothetical protein
VNRGTSYLRYRPIHAPRADGSALVEPPLAEVPDLVAGNLARQGQYQYDVQGRSLTELAWQARCELVAQARRFTMAYRDVDCRAPGAARPVFLAGHQPQLFHPGVWLKNLALGRLAARQGAAAVNLIIDSDTMKEHALRVPGGTPAQPHLATLPLDRPGPRIPFEERRILEPQVLADFGRRAAGQIAGLVSDPLVRRFWPMVTARMRDSDNLGTVLAQARHQLEGQWGITTLELPQSRVCDMESFAWFACHLLAQLPRLRAVYNESVAEYRRTHHIRSLAHPVPDLTKDGLWLEAPFWVWTRDDPQRRRLFARQRRGEVVLTDRHQVEAAIPLDADREAGRAVDAFRELAARGIKIRSRALVTTLWARLALGSLFLHGIGGAKYDQVTDALIARFFGLDPPGILILSATLLLPIPRRRTTADDLRAIKQRLRELEYHPERFLDSSGGAATRPELPFDARPDAGMAAEPWISEKHRWIHTPPTAANAQARHDAIREANRALQPWVAGRREQLRAQLRQIEAALRAEAILSSREYSFCLYPEETLRKFLFGLLPPDE